MPKNDGDLCEYCMKRPGLVMEDPYLSEIEDDHTLYVLCDPCADESADNI